LWKFKKTKLFEDSTTEQGGPAKGKVCSFATMYSNVDSHGLLLFRIKNNLIPVGGDKTLICSDNMNMATAISQY